MKTWTTKTGEEIALKDMETSHIKNCIRYLERKIENGDVMETIGDMSGDCEERWADEIDMTGSIESDIKDFKEELSIRE